VQFFVFYIFFKVLHVIQIFLKIQKSAYIQRSRRCLDDFTSTICSNDAIDMALKSYEVGATFCEYCFLKLQIKAYFILQSAYLK
jgi:hypothetical protein